MLVPFTPSPLDGLDLPWLLDAQAKAMGEKPFLTWSPFEGPDSVYSYAEFHESVGRTASGMHSRGIREGDRVLVHLNNCPEFLISWCALAELGAIAVTTNARSSVEELRYFIENSNCTAGLTQPALLETVQNAGASLKWLACIDHDGGVPADPTGSSVHFSELLKAEPMSPRRQVTPDPHRTLAIQYTSGTTSRPKGVLITHGNALWAGMVGSNHQRLISDDIHLFYAPLFHINALSYSFLPTLWSGASCVLLPRFSASRFWEYAERHQATWCSMISFALRTVPQINPGQSHSFRCWGGAFADAPLAQAHNIKMIGWYGMTETISHPIASQPHLPNRQGVVGRATPEYGVMISRPDGSPVEYDEPGLLKIKGIRGISIFAGYLNDERTTNNAFDDEGWFITGDRVVPLSDGTIRFGDRDKDMLKVGGENVAPSEVERVISAVPGVAEVAVIGIQHKILEEVPIAFIRLSPATSSDQMDMDIMAACQTSLADFKAPRRLVYVEDFPRAALDKIAKHQLKGVYFEKFQSSFFE